MDDILIKSVHLAPLVSYVLQIGAIHADFTLAGTYRHVLSRILWLVALFVFILVAVGAQDSRCLYDYTNMGIHMISYVLCIGFVISYDRAKRLRETNQKQELVVESVDCKSLQVALIIC
jgi:hypothetical protein